MVKVVIFDIGGVLVENSYFPLLCQLAEQYQIDLAKLQSFATPFFDQVMLGGMNEVELFDQISRHFDLSESGEELDIKVGELFRPIAPVWDYVKQLHGRYRLAILSDLGNGWISRHEREFDIEKYFEHLFYSSRLKMRKPDPRFFQHLLATMGVTPAECVFIDDKPDNIAAAQNLGMNGIIYKDSTQLRQELAELGVQLTEPRAGV